MQIHSKPPHDFYLTFDAEGYYEAEYDPMVVAEQGYVRPLVLDEREVLAVVRWNENPDDPVFDVTFPEHDLSTDEKAQAERQLRRILGADLDLGALMEQAEDDPMLGPLMTEHYGFKRLAKANLWEECVDDFIRSRIRHRPTAKRMSQDVRRTYGSTFIHNGVNYYSYPRPEGLIGVEPETFREFGVSKRKGEYITGLAQLIVDGEFDVDEHEQMDPDEFYEKIQNVRGIGPSTAQTLMYFRNHDHATFPIRKDRDGNEKGMRRWFIRAYGGDPNDTSDEEFQQMIATWQNYESLAFRFLYLDWILKEKKNKS